MHLVDRLAVLEIEEAVAEEPLDFISVVQGMVRRLQSASGPIAACQSAADEVRAVTGFDRVVVYRFLSDGAVLLKRKQGAAT